MIGIHALAKLGEKLATKDNNVAITFTYENGGQSQININPSNVMILQKHTVNIIFKIYYFFNLIFFILFFILFNQ